jgi:hypothetical protein
MPLIKVYNNDSDPYGLKGHSIFKSVRPFIFGYAIISKLHEWYLRHLVRATSAEAVSFRRTFSDEAWSQQSLLTPQRSLAVQAKTSLFLNKNISKVFSCSPNSWDPSNTFCSAMSSHKSIGFG